MNRSGFQHATVIGSGPNGLAAAIELARNGCSVRVLEAAETIGGGTRTEEITLPGFLHDICSAVHPLGVSSPFFRSVPLDEHGLEWIYPPTQLAHPFDDGTAILLERSVDETGETLREDAAAYRKLMQPLVDDWEKLAPDILGPLKMPRHPFAYVRFGLRAMRSASGLAKSHFRNERTRGFFAGLAAHSMLPLTQLFTASFGLILGITGHAVGWTIPLGGEIVVNSPVESINDLLTDDSAVLCDLTPRGLLKVAGNHLPDGYKRKLERFRYGAAAFKIDWALNAPIPWKAKEATRAGTVHLGGTLAEIAASEAAPEKGEHPEKPYVLVVQQSLFDSTRAPEGKHTGWAYCHVPNGSTFDMTERIENQIERFAPGFRDCIIAKNIMPPAALERHNANNVGGNISGGSTDLQQLFMRPTRRTYSTPIKGLYICSSSTPPGGGVHGMCGFYAARAVLKG